MSVSNHNWVCFECRLVTRQAKTSDRIPKCLSCGSDSFCLGYKVEVPRKDDVRGWNKLREDCRLREIERIKKETDDKRKRLSSAEERVAQLEKLPVNKDRSKLIAQIRKTITAANT